MAAKIKADEPEKTVPVFTVLKNNSILKNIFLLHDPSPIPQPKPNPIENGDYPVQEFEETLMIGRHPDCNIKLDHPSISRFHLRIVSRPNSQNLSVFDLSSVHGTWVSGKRIEPGIGVELSEGDTLRIGGSSRVYRLHWVPLSGAYDLENPFVSKSEEVEESKEEEAYQECMNSPSLSDEEVECNSMKEHKESFCLYSEPLKTGTAGQYFTVGDSCKTEIHHFNEENESPGPSVSLEVLSEIKESERSNEGLGQNLNLLESMKSLFSEEVNNRCSLRTDHDQKEVPGYFHQPPLAESVNSSLPCEIVISQIYDKKSDEENQSPEPHLGTKGLFEMKTPESPPIGSKEKYSLPVSLNSSSSDKEEGHQVTESFQVAENEDPLRKEHDVQEFRLVQSGPLAAQSVNSCLFGEVCFPKLKANNFEKVNQSPHTHSTTGGSQAKNPESPPNNSEQKCNLPGIWSRRGNPSSFLQLETGRTVGKRSATDIIAEDELPHQRDVNNYAISKVLFTGLDGNEAAFTPENENFTPNALILMSTNKMGKVEQIMDSMSYKSSSSKNKEISMVLSIGSDRGEDPFTPNKENFTPNTVLLRSIKKLGKVEEIKHSTIHRSACLENAVNPNIHLEEDILASSGKEIQTPNVLQERKSMRSASRNQRSHLESQVMEKSRVERMPLQPLFVNSSSKNQSEAFVLGTTTEVSNSFCKNKEISMVLSIGSDRGEDSFTPNKENFTPNTVLLGSIKKLGKVEEIKHSKIHISACLENAVNPNIHLEEDILASSGKEIQIPKVLQERKSMRSASRNQGSCLESQVMEKSRVERMPLQPRLVNSSSKNQSEAFVLGTTTEISNPFCKNATADVKRRWNMVVDTNCLLNKDSRKALQLLQGLKGTRLIIPRIVMRELDSMKQQGSLFRGTTEASSTLQWIEECVLNANWWIHIQSSEEERSPIAPTPPASPWSQFSWGSGWWFPGGAASSVPFSTWGSLLEFVSPTAEDHILECALLFSNTKSDGQFVLLTNDVTLKIKAMAEGLICETAQKFRESLVNPFSERFLWPDSSPRGLTWSCADDIVLREKYYCCPTKLEAPKGLKLILPHYAQSSVN